MYSKFRIKIKDVMTRLKFCTISNFFGFHLKSKKKMDSRIFSLVLLSCLLTVCKAENITEDPNTDPQIDCGEGIMIPGLNLIIHLSHQMFHKARPFYKRKEIVIKTVYLWEQLTHECDGVNWLQFGDRISASPWVSAWAGGSSTSWY